MPRYALIEKQIGETPLQALEKYRASNAALEGISMTYAGRLDPMASGILLILIGEECKNRDEYTNLDKTYEFEVLLGVETDTGDVLGIPETPHATEYTEAAIHKVMTELLGEHVLPYPAYSSKTVKGTPLFEYALSGTLGEIEMPTTMMRVNSMEYLGLRTVSAEALLQEILEKLSLVAVPATSDFRIDEITERWKAVLTQGEFLILKARAEVSSGTYIRSLAPLLASKLGTRGLAFSIHRTGIKGVIV